jgi:hypothetical protein
MLQHELLVTLTISAVLAILAQRGRIARKLNAVIIFSPARQSLNNTNSTCSWL